MQTENIKLDGDVVAAGTLDEDDANQNNVIPLSYAGRTRCMTHAYRDGMAASHVHDSPDIITTFTCNPKWAHITKALKPEEQEINKAVETVRIYRVKLLEYLQKIKDGKIFGPVITVLHNIEFKKNVLPHARILVWQKKRHNKVIMPTFMKTFVSTTGSELADTNGDTPAFGQMPRLERGEPAVAESNSSDRLES